MGITGGVLRSCITGGVFTTAAQNMPPAQPALRSYFLLDQTYVDFCLDARSLFFLSPPNSEVSACLLYRCTGATYTNTAALCIPAGTTESCHHQTRRANTPLYSTKPGPTYIHVIRPATVTNQSHSFARSFHVQKRTYTRLNTDIHTG